MYTYTYTLHLHIHIHTYTYTYIYIHACVHIYIYIYTCVYLLILLLRIIIMIIKIIILTSLFERGLPRGPKLETATEPAYGPLPCPSQLGSAGRYLYIYIYIYMVILYILVERENLTDNGTLHFPKEPSDPHILSYFRRDADEKSRRLRPSGRFLVLFVVFHPGFGHLTQG